jgi:serralysin
MTLSPGEQRGLQQQGILLPRRGAMVAPWRQEDTTMAIVFGTGASETLNALDGVTNSADKIFGLAGNDNIYALGGNDEILGGHGADRIDGGSGIDTASYGDSGTGVFIDLTAGRGYHGTAEGDTLVGIENLTGSAYGDGLLGNGGSNVLRGMGGNDSLSGFGAADTLYGGDANDTIGGDGGNDILHGDAGNDILLGGAATDTLVGGSGGDSFVWQVAEDTGADANTADVITDFNFAEGDRISLFTIDADVTVSGNQAFTFIGNAAFSGTPGEVNYIHSNGDTLIQLQTGTSPDAEAVIRLAGILTPEATWFSL